MRIARAKMAYNPRNMVLGRLFVFGCVFGAAACSFGQGFVGKWSGGIDISSLNFPKPKNAREQKILDSRLVLFRAMKVSLSLQANNTFTMHAEGGIQAKPMDDEGTWKPNGKGIDLKVAKKDGKILRDDESMPMSALLAAKGKKLVLNPPSGKFRFVLVKK